MAVMSLPAIYDQYQLGLIATASSLLAIIVSSIIIFQLWRPRYYTGISLPPGSLGLPLVGETLDFFRMNRTDKPLEFVGSRITKYGEVFKTHLLGYPTVVPTGPAGNRLLFANENKLVHLSWPYSTILTLGTHSLIAKTGSDAKRIRHALMTFLRPQALQTFTARCEFAAKNFFDRYWKHKDEVLVYPSMDHFSFSIACSIFASRDDDEEQHRLEERFRDFKKGILGLPIDLPGTRVHKAIRARNILRQHFDQWIEQRRRDLETGKFLRDHDLLSYMLSYRDQEGQPLSEDEIRDNLLLVLFAGHDTTTITMTMLCKDLAEYPEYFEEVWKEQEEIASRKQRQEWLNWEDVQRMKMSWRCVQETLRLHTPGPGGFRIAIKDFDYQNYVIPKGWKLHWNANATHRDARYFPEPEQYRPSRFEGSGPPSYTFVPFGGGLRICPGIEFARMVILVMLHHLVRRYRWELVDPQERIAFDPFPVPVRGMPIKLHPRIAESTTSA